LLCDYRSACCDDGTFQDDGEASQSTAANKKAATMTIAET
jgi:hypothetical protein